VSSPPFSVWLSAPTLPLPDPVVEISWRDADLMRERTSAARPLRARDLPLPLAARDPGQSAQFALNPLRDNCCRLDRVSK